MSVMDFGVLPPEVNSGLMYAGAGSGPMVAAAAAWDGWAAELSSAATSYRAVVSELTGQSWLGPSSATMAASAAPYVAWMDTTAAQAEQTASQARSHRFHSLRTVTDLARCMPSHWSVAWMKSAGRSRGDQLSTTRQKWSISHLARMSF